MELFALKAFLVKPSLGYMCRYTGADAKLYYSLAEYGTAARMPIASLS